MNQIHAEYSAARDQAKAQGTFGGESECRTAWFSQPHASLEALAALYGVPDQHSVLSQYGEVVHLAIRGNVGLREGDVPAGMAMSDGQTLAGLDQYLDSDMNQALIALYGQGPVEAPGSASAREQVRLYGQDRYEKLMRLQRALEHVQKDFADQLAAAQADPNPPAEWMEDGLVQQTVMASGAGDTGGYALTQTVTGKVFSVEKFSQWYVAQQTPSNQAFAALYGVAHQAAGHEVTYETGTQIVRGPVTFQVRGADAGEHTLTLDANAGRIVDADLVNLNLNAPPDLHNAEAVYWNPLLGWVTAQQNIDEGTDWAGIILGAVFVAVVSVCTYGAATGWASAGLAQTVAAGAAAGAAGSAASGAINGNFNWGAVLRGGAFGALSAGLNYGVGTLASDTANTANAAQAGAAGASASGASAASTGMNLTSVAGRALVSGTMSELRGGDFLDGAVVSLAGSGGQVIGGQAGQVVASSVASASVAQSHGGDFSEALAGSLVDGSISALPAAVDSAKPGWTSGEELVDREATPVTTGSTSVAAPAPAPARTSGGEPVGPQSSGTSGEVAPTTDSAASSTGQVSAQENASTANVDSATRPPATGETHGATEAPVQGDQAPAPSHTGTPVAGPTDSDFSVDAHRDDSAERSPSTDDGAPDTTEAQRQAQREAFMRQERAGQNAADPVDRNLTPSTSQYRVQAGDTLEQIARREYARTGVPVRWRSWRPIPISGSTRTARRLFGRGKIWR